ncbi:MAG: class I SAM-dependent methyltransferase [Planctomycetota bacterium]
MSSCNADNYTNEDAVPYDRQAREHGWHGHEVLFGLMYEFIKSGETLLDVGIGTGLGSYLFHQAGLQVSGFDRSKEMLEMCKSKGFAARLDQHDLQHVPFPYQSISFNHVISLAVLNFFRDLAPLVEEAARIIRPGGIFALTVEEQKTGQPAKYVYRAAGDALQPGAETGVNMYRHSDAHIRGLLASSGFSVLKDLEFLADQHSTGGMNIYFKVYVAQKAERA